MQNLQKVTSVHFIAGNVSFLFHFYINNKTLKLVQTHFFADHCLKLRERRGEVHAFYF